MNHIRNNAAEPKRVNHKLAYGPIPDLFFLAMRTYRDENDHNCQLAPRIFLGAEQLAWRSAERADSKAKWKVIAADTLLGSTVNKPVFV